VILDKESEQTLVGRWMIRKDLHQVLEIDSLCFEPGFTEDALTEMLAEPQMVGWVLERGHEILGYYVFQVCSDHFFLERLAIDPQHQRNGFGTLLIDLLKDRIKPGRPRNSIRVYVDEYDLNSQLFFQAQDFLAIDKDRANNRDYIIMEYYAS